MFQSHIRSLFQLVNFGLAVLLLCFIAKSRQVLLLMHMCVYMYIQRNCVYGSTNVGKARDAMAVV